MTAYYMFIGFNEIITYHRNCRYPISKDSDTHFRSAVQGFKDTVMINIQNHYKFVMFPKTWLIDIECGVIGFELYNTYIVRNQTCMTISHRKNATCIILFELSIKKHETKQFNSIHQHKQLYIGD